MEYNEKVIVLNEIIATGLKEGLIEKLELMSQNKHKKFTNPLFAERRKNIQSLFLGDDKKKKLFAEVLVEFEDKNDRYNILITARDYMADVLESIFDNEGDVVSFLRNDKNAFARVATFDRSGTPKKHIVYYFEH